MSHLAAGIQNFNLPLPSELKNDFIEIRESSYCPVAASARPPSDLEAPWPRRTASVTWSVLSGRDQNACWWPVNSDLLKLNRD